TPEASASAPETPAPGAPAPEDAAPAPEAPAAAPAPSDEPAEGAGADRAPGAADAAEKPAGMAVEDLNRLWHEEVIPDLTGMTKAMFSVGRFTAFDAGVATLALPNEVHRQKCQQKRPEVEGVLRDRLSPDLRLDLVVDDSDGEGGGRRGGGGPGGP